MLNCCRLSSSIYLSFSTVWLIFIYMYTSGRREWSVLSRIKAWTPSQGSTPRPLDMGVQHAEHWATSTLFWVPLEWQSYLLFPCLDLDISSMLCTTQKKDCNMFIYISYLISSKLQGYFLCSLIVAWMKCIRSHLDRATSQLNLNFLKKSWRLPFMFRDKTVNKTKIYPVIAKMLTCVIRS